MTNSFSYTNYRLRQFQTSYFNFHLPEARLFTNLHDYGSHKNACLSVLTGLMYIQLMKFASSLLTLLITLGAVAGPINPLIFSKDLDQSHLENMASMDAHAVAKYIRAQGVELMLMPLTEKPLSKLEQEFLAPASLQANHKKYFIEEGVIGRYLSNLGFSPEVSKPTIIVVSIDDKWTLLHEFMHYLFEINRLKNDPTADAKLANSQSDARDDFLNASTHYRSDPSPKNLGTAINAFNDYAKLELEISSQLTIEEILIEKIILDSYVSQRMKHLKASQSKSARLYILSNAERVQGYLRNMLSSGNDLLALRPENLSLIRTISELNKFQASLESLLAP